MTPRRTKVWVAAVALTTATATYLYWQGMQSAKLTGKDSSTVASDAHPELNDLSTTARDASTSTKLKYSLKPNPGTVIASIGEGAETGPMVEQSAVSTTGHIDLGADSRSPRANINGAEPLYRPRGWKVTGVQAANCILKSDFNYVQSGTASALLQTIANDTVSSCGFGQASAVGKFRGQRVAFSAYLATQDVTGSGALWFRADDGSGAVVAFQNQLRHGLSGTSPWTAEVLVIDVPDTANNIFYGAVLSGSGMLWVDSADFNVVNKTVAVTGPAFRDAAYPGKILPDPTRIPPAPYNLNFDETVPLDQ
jgi:hypothetical protein